MSRRSSGNHDNSKPTKAAIQPNTQKENTDQLIEMAAEQFAVLLWKTWLYEKKVNKREKKINPH